MTHSGGRDPGFLYDRHKPSPFPVESSDGAVVGCRGSAVLAGSSISPCFPDHEERSVIGSHLYPVSASTRPLFDYDISYVFLLYWILPAPGNPKRCVDSLILSLVAAESNCPVLRAKFITRPLGRKKVGHLLQLYDRRSQLDEETPYSRLREKTCHDSMAAMFGYCSGNLTRGLQTVAKCF